MSVRAKPNCRECYGRGFVVVMRAVSGGTIRGEGMRKVYPCGCTRTASAEGRHVAAWVRAWLDIGRARADGPDMNLEIKDVTWTTTQSAVEMEGIVLAHALGHAQATP